MLNEISKNIVGGSAIGSGLIWFGSLFAKHNTSTAAGTAVLISLLMVFAGLIFLGIGKGADR